MMASFGISIGANLAVSKLIEPTTASPRASSGHGRKGIIAKINTLKTSYGVAMEK